MIDDSTRLSPAEIGRTNANLKLVSQFIQELLDWPEDADPIPLGATVVLLPPEDQGDSELRRANLRMAQRLATEGRNVVLWTVGAQEPASSQMLAGQTVAGRDD